VALLFAKEAREVAEALPSDKAYPLRGWKNARRAQLTAEPQHSIPRNVSTLRMPRSMVNVIHGQRNAIMTRPDAIQ
jgi:hypothetical protein